MTAKTLIDRLTFANVTLGSPLIEEAVEALKLARDGGPFGGGREGAGSAQGASLEPSPPIVDDDPVEADLFEDEPW